MSIQGETNVYFLHLKKNPIELHLIMFAVFFFSTLAETWQFSLSRGPVVFI